MLCSVRSANRGSATLSDIPSLSQNLSVEQIKLGYQKYAHSVELKRILGVTFGISSQDHSFGVSHSKPIPPLPIKKLKMFQDSLQDTLGSARDRAIFWQRSICKLDGYDEAARSTKRQRLNNFSSESIGQRNIMKMGDSNICNRLGDPPQKVEDNTMSSGLEIKEHLRTSMLDTQIDGRSAQVTRQLIIAEKCRGMLKVGDDIHFKEKIPRLLAGGSGWDRKRKGKRSCGTAGNRLITVEKNVKQAVSTKPSAETMLRPLQAQSCRSRASSTMVGIYNSVKAHFRTPLGSSAELASTVTVEKIVPPGKNNTVTGKISRTPKTCSIPVLDSSSDFRNSSGANTGGEQGVNKSKPTSSSVVNSTISPMSSTNNASKIFSAKLMVPPTMVKVKNSRAKNPLPSVCSLDEYRSKSGCPPAKKQMIQKSSIHSGKVVNSGFPGYAAELEDDREELLFAAEFARNASYRACSSLFWKKMECYFTSVTPQDESYLEHQLDFADALSGCLHQIPGDENVDLDDLELQEKPINSGGRQESPADQESIETAALSKCSDMTKTFGEAPSLFQRLLSALIEDDESKEMSLQSEGRNDFQSASDDSYCGSCNYNDFEAENRNTMAFKDVICKRKGRHINHEIESEVDLQIRKQGLMGGNYCYKSVSSNNESNRSVCSSICNNEHWQADDGLSYYAGYNPRISQSDLGSSLESNASPISSPIFNYHVLSVEDKLRLELQNIDLCPEMDQIADGEDEINQDIIKLQAELVQQAQKMKKCIKKIHKSIQHGKVAEKRNLEQAAMSKLTEMAYKKQRASHGSHSSKRVLRRASKQVALRFAERTLARCREFEDTGKSCFSEAALQNIIFSTPTSNSDPNSVNKHASRSTSGRFKSSLNPNLQAKGSGSMDRQQYMGMNQELLPNDVRKDSSRAMSGGTVMGKRSERAKDQTIKIISNQVVPHIGHPPVGSSAGVHKSKLKSKVKESLFLASKDEPGGRYMEPTHAASDSPRVSSLSMAIVSDIARKKEELHNEEKNLVVPPSKQLTNSISFEHRDYTSLMDFDVDGLQDQDSWQGLCTPMDDLSDLHIF